MKHIFIAISCLLAITKCAENEDDNPLEWLRNSIPGEPGEDYPLLASTQETSFSCEGLVFGGYYADPELQCQEYHVCLRQAETPDILYPVSFLCPNGTIFNQRLFNCDWWFNVDCAASADLYFLAEGAFGSDGEGSAGECPAASPGSDSDCSSAVSNCWSPGQRDTDCPDYGLCCFDGCADTCVDGPKPQRAQQTPDKNQGNTAKVPSKPAKVPNKPVKVPNKPAKVPSKPAKVPNKPEKVPTRPVKVPTQPAKVPTRPVKVPTRPAKVPTRPVKVPTRPAKVPTRPANVPSRPDESILFPEEIIPSRPKVTTRRPTTLNKVTTRRPTTFNQVTTRRPTTFNQVTTRRTGQVTSAGPTGPTTVKVTTYRPVFNPQSQLTTKGYNYDVPEVPFTEGTVNKESSTGYRYDVPDIPFIIERQTSPAPDLPTLYGAPGIGRRGRRLGGGRNRRRG